MKRIKLCLLLPPCAESTLLTASLAQHLAQCNIDIVNTPADAEIVLGPPDEQILSKTLHDTRVALTPPPRTNSTISISAPQNHQYAQHAFNRAAKVREQRYKTAYLNRTKKK